VNRVTSRVIQLMPSPAADLLLVSPDHPAVGSGRQLELAAVALQQAGWRVQLAVLTTGGSLADRLAPIGVTVNRLGRRPVIDSAVVPRLIQFSRRLQPAVVLAWGRRVAVPVAAARLVCRRLGLGSWRYLQWLAQSPRSGIELEAVQAAEQILVTDAAVAAGCAAQAVVVPPAAAAFATAGSREQLAASLGIDPANRWTLTVAPLVAASRLEQLLWAIDQMGVVRDDLDHVIVGAGPLARRLARRARIEELASRVHFFDQLDCLPELLPETDLIMQSGRVALGGCLLEGLAEGIPLVAIDTPESRAVIGDGDAGRLVPAVPESEFARRAIQLLEDRDLAAACTAAGRRRVAERFDPQASAAALVAAVGGPTADLSLNQSP